MANTELSKTEFIKLLQQANHPVSNVDLSDKIMRKIQIIDLKNKVYDKYIRSSWFFIALATILAVKGISVLTLVESTFAQWTNSLIPGLSEIVTFTLLSALAGLIFYQLNNLITQRMAN